jgi:hypothetical protein
MVQWFKFIYLFYVILNKFFNLLLFQVYIEVNFFFSLCLKIFYNNGDYNIYFYLDYEFFLFLF